MRRVLGLLALWLLISGMLSGRTARGNQHTAAAQCGPLMFIRSFHTEPDTVQADQTFRLAP